MEGDRSMAGFMDKVGDFFFKNDEGEDEFKELEEQSIPAVDRKAIEQKKATKKTNIISVPSRGKNSDNLEIVLFKAVTYDDMQEIARHIKERKIAVVNFEDMDKAVAQRMVDFLSGAAFALDGVPRKVSGGTFIFSCSQVDVSGQIMEGEGGTFEAEDFTDDERFSSNQWLRS